MSNIERMLAGRASASHHVPWSEPLVLDAGVERDSAILESVLQNGSLQVVDNVEHIANDMFEVNQPSLKGDDEGRQQFASNIREQGASFGRWVLFPWNNQLVRYPNEQDHLVLRTARNKNLVTETEQDKLYNSEIAVFGLSVGSHVVESLVIAGIGKYLTIGDADVISPTNLNRLRGSMVDIGAHKVDHLAKKISLVDPYTRQTHLKDGFTPENFTATDASKLDVLVDEVDDIEAKVRMRLLAEQQGVPLVMATDVGDTSIIDVERYDLGDAKPFHGALKPKTVAQILDGTIGDVERKKLVGKIVGIKNVSARLIASVMEIDRSLAGMPQLGNAAIAGGALATVALREILLDRHLPSGRYIVSPKKNLKLKSPTSTAESLRIIRDFLHQ